MFSPKLARDAQAEETEARFDRAREFARRSAVEKEEMETTLLDVAADLENLARNYRQVVPGTDHGMHL